MRKPPQFKTHKHGKLLFNDGNNSIQLNFDIKSPHCFSAFACMFMISEEYEVRRIVANVCKRYKKYFKQYLGCEKDIIIFDYPNRIEKGERFCITVDVAGLITEHLTKEKLLAIGETISKLMESMTRDLNAQWVLLERTTKGNRKRPEKE